MGNEYSTEEEPLQAQTANLEDPTDISALSGYRVMKVFQGSPASRSGLRSFEDFILAVNETLVNSDNASLAQVLSTNEGKELQLAVWNVVDSAKRNVTLVPVKWNGPGLLGAAVRYEAVSGAMDHVQRVVDVLPQSPADEAGLVPHTDYIVGTPAEVFRKESDFSRLIAEALERSAAASFMVYSSATNRVRNVEIRPDRNWGGEGSVGCELATGLLHRISRNSA